MSDLSDEDKKLLKEAMQGVTKLGDTGKKSALSPKNRKPPKRDILSKNDLDPNAVHTEFAISHERMLQHTPQPVFNRGGIQLRQLKRLQQGKIPFEAEIDLHHLTLEEAQQIVHRFINECRSSGLKCIKIIHGRGLHSQPGRTTLLHFVRYLLTQKDEVLAYSAAPRAMGGDGAVLILLKRQHND